MMKVTYHCQRCRCWSFSSYSDGTLVGYWEGRTIAGMLAYFIMAGMVAGEKDVLTVVYCPETLKCTDQTPADYRIGISPT